MLFQRIQRPVLRNLVKTSPRSPNFVYQAVGYLHSLSSQVSERSDFSVVAESLVERMMKLHTDKGNPFTLKVLSACNVAGSNLEVNVVDRKSKFSSSLLKFSQITNIPNAIHRIWKDQINGKKGCALDMLTFYCFCFIYRRTVRCTKI